MNYAIEQRLRFIDVCLPHYGYINRRILMDYFGISIPQASKDISDYNSLAPKAMVYNKRSKRYEATTGFTPNY